MGQSSQQVGHSYLYCMDRGFGYGNRTFFTFFSQFNRGESSSLLAGVEATVLILFFLLSTSFNGAIFYTLSSNRRLRTVTNYFVCNLTLADICFTLCCPLVAVVRVTGSWSLGSFACKTTIFLSGVGGLVILWTLMLISVDRFRCIVQNTRRRISPRLARLLIFNVWLLTAIIVSPLITLFRVKECPLGDETVSICTFAVPLNYGFVYTCIVCFLGLFFPSLVLVFAHIAIFIKVHKAKLAIDAQRNCRFGSVAYRLPALSSRRYHYGHKRSIVPRPNKVNSKVPPATDQEVDASPMDTATFSSSEDSYDDQRQKPSSDEDCALELAAVSSDHNVNQQDQKVVSFRRFTTTGLDFETISADPHQNHHRLLHVGRSTSRHLSLDVKQFNNSSTPIAEVATTSIPTTCFRNSQTDVHPDRKQTTTEVMTTLNVHGRPSSGDRVRIMTTPEAATSWYLRPAYTHQKQNVVHRDTNTSSSRQTPIGHRAPCTSVHICSNRFCPTTVSTKEHWCKRNTRVGTRTTLVYLVLLFIALWTPTFVVFVLLLRDENFDVQELSSHFFLGAMFAAYSHAIINPWVYGLTSQKLVQHLKDLLGCPKRPNPSKPSKARNSNRVGSRVRPSLR